MSDKFKYVFINLFYSIEAISLVIALIFYRFLPDGIVLATGPKDDLVKWIFFLPFGAMIFYGNKAKDFVLVLSGHDFPSKWKFFYKYNINLSFLLIYFILDISIYVKTWFHPMNFRDFGLLVFLGIACGYNVIILYHADIKLKDIEKSILNKVEDAS